MANDLSVLISAPTGRDANLIEGLLSSRNIRAQRHSGLGGLAHEIDDRTGAIILAEEALSLTGKSDLFQALNAQPPWSDVPLILLTLGSRGVGTKNLLGQDWAAGRNVMVVDRPVRRVALISTVTAALQERAHQFEIRDYIEERKKKDDQLRQTQKLESIGILAGGVAHDFNNLLTGVLGNASLALNELPLGHAARAYLDEISEAAKRAADLTSQLLAYSGKGKFLIEPIDVSELIRQISRLVRLSIPKRVQLLLNLGSEPAIIEADASQIQQVIMNLIINAAEAIGVDRDGVVSVRTGVVDTSEKNGYDLYAAKDLKSGRYVIITVTDNGSGMDEATLGKIFDPFFTTKFTGRGLGLAAVLGIVRGHKGALSVHSAPGKGSAFEVLLPASAKPLDRRPAPASTIHRGSGVVLVVDDEPVVLRLAKAALGQAGYTVLLASDGREALEIFREEADRIAVVLLDLTMPVLSGEETFEKLKQLRPSVDVILTSGYSEAEATQRFAGKPLAGFIQKPYSSRALAEKVTSVLSTRPLVHSHEPARQ